MSININMKKLITSVISLILFLSLTPLTLAEFSVVPSPPNQRQFNFEIMPGEEEPSSIIVKNLGNNPITVNVYSTDATNSSQGTFAITSKSHEQKHIGTWVTFKNDLPTIQPKEDIEIPFLIQVPKNATPGNYGGGIAVEASSAQMKGEKEITNGNAINTAARIYIKTFVKIPGDRIQDYEWTNFEYKSQTVDKKSSFNFSLKNNGNTIIIAKPSIELKGVPPLKENKLTLPEVTIQPGTELTNLELKWNNKPPIGLYFVTAQVEFSEYDIVLNKKTNSSVYQQKITINLTPWYIIAIILLVVLLLIGTTTFKIISRKQLLAKCKTYKITKDDTITSLAKKAGISWQTLAKINKIKSPYLLKEGQTILLPPKK